MEDNKLHGYIEQLLPERPQILAEMEQFAKKNQVPIMEILGMEAMLQLFRIQEPKTILEVGTAIGYSALRMAFALPDTKIVSIERDAEKFALAEKYIKKAGKDSQITMIKGDALEAGDEIKALGPYDAIFIDAAKGQYQNFFNIYSPFLNEKGIIVTDNVLFKGLVCEKDIENKRIRSLVKKIDQFNRWLMGHPDFHTIILPVGDGIAISKKR
ncbi:O-methyltransferase [Bacillus methanolicus]|uniref:tRNA 5-hydroxyuridine methyltransferase n=1 Tax=Bacillus methanolicus (strain MGA3 / ATCC 53907) TaxID=796606 RepID=I3EAT0_BACMM|nr:O-methyltransferase [Bacillus methanolicus]AIE60838.1 Putative O-methyltransferase YrrM [Bacillus methanolicus MGA3]EIJ83601.1 O-methyltransferase [Bacillus methanolicus MGA3]UQD52841.1 O-methyltransferase [Bacillus methanolicus]